MSKNLKKSSYFIRLILQNNIRLTRILLTHATEKQLQSIAEIFYNVFKLPLSKAKRENFLKHLKLLKKYIENKKARKTIILRNLKIFNKLILLLRPYLNVLLK